MARTIDAILTDLNDKLGSRLSYSDMVFKNLAVLEPIDGATFPMERINEREGRKISPFDQQGLTFYHRIESEDREDIQGKGNTVYYRVIYNMVLVGIGYRPNITRSTNWNNEDIAQIVMNALAEDSFLDFKEQVLVQGRPTTDKLTALNEEYVNNNIMKEKVLDLIAFKIPYTLKVQQFPCGQFTQLNSITYNNNKQSIDVATVDAALGTSFQSMTPFVSPNGATVSYSSSDIPAGLSINSSTGEVFESTWEDIPLGLNSFTITATGTGDYGGSLTFDAYFIKVACKVMTQTNYDLLSDTDAQMYYLILE